jgi:hypothetical protein
MPAELITDHSSIHYVKSTKFSPEQLEGKTLRWFLQEEPLNCSLEVSGPLESGEFILYAKAYSIGNVQEDEATHGHKWAELLDQETVDQIRVSGASRFLRGFDFVIFQQSPIACELCRVPDSGSAHRRQSIRRCQSRLP